MHVAQVSRIDVAEAKKLVEESKMKNFLVIGAVLATVAACGNKSEPKNAASAPPQAAQSTPVPTPPAQPNAVDDGVQRPTPGQAGDHSSPAFKGGGKPDPKK